MDSLVFFIQGSEKEPYKVSFLHRGSNITATCTCQAGKHGLHCKHRINLLNGINKGLVCDKDSDLATLISWIPGSDLEGLLREFTELECRSNEIKNELATVKKRLARALLD